MFAACTPSLERRSTSPARRVKGQIEAVEGALSQERGCEGVVRTIAAARGAIAAAPQDLCTK
jgi:DNA-binding FrmR family transcriptional regulator